MSYPHFHASAALLCKDDTVYTGNNIENAAYSVTVCVERSVSLRTLDEGEREFEVIVICGRMNGEIADCRAFCGVYRQVVREFCSPEILRIVLAKMGDDYRVFTPEELLPLGFGPESLR